MSILTDPSASAAAGIDDRLAAVRAAAQGLRALSPGRGSEKKNAALAAAARLLADRKAEILSANAQDLAALGSETTIAFRDRLLLDDKRIALMCESLNQVERLADPVAEEVERRTLANGLVARRVRAPLGVVLMIFESRPNVAVESWSLALKSGNAIILRGGKESMRTTGALYRLLSDALVSAGLPADGVWGITDPDRALTTALLKRDREIDVVVPRGGDSLIQFVVTNARMPVIKNDRGLCHVYVHDDADEAMALEILFNAKCQRPGVCNSAETLLVHQAVAARFLPKAHERLKSAGVNWFVDERAFAAIGALGNVERAEPASFDTEYLDLKISCAVVDSLDAAIAHVERHGSRHSESIITRSEPVARAFQDRVDAAAVYWNASTRFTDGFELGLGGELGISTQKLHVRGPVGLRELTSVRWIMDGTGQTRR